MRLFYILSIACFLTACAPLDRVSSSGEDDGIGGTGYRGDPDTDGIGGTGLWASTVRSGDVALYGVVTSLDTLVVNGHSMFLSEGLETWLNGEPSTVAALNLGQVVAVRVGLVDGVVTAKAIYMDDVMLGPIDAIATNREWLEVLGQRVMLGDYTRVVVVRGDGGSADLRTGDIVRISGLRRLNGSIDASLVQSAEPNRSYFVAGWAQSTADGQFRLGQLTLAAAELAGLMDSGQRLVVTGDIHEDNFGARRIMTRPLIPFAADVKYWSVQGYAAREGMREIRFASYRGVLTGGDDIGLELAREQRVIMHIQTEGTSEPEVQGVIPSPPQHPDSKLFIPLYIPTMPQPVVDIVPRVQLPGGRTGPVIDVLPKPNPTVPQMTGAPAPLPTPVVRPSIPKLPLPPVDIKSHDVLLPSVIDTGPSIIMRPGRSLR